MITMLSQDYPNSTTAAKFEQKLRHDDGDGNQNSICDGDGDDIDDDNDDNDDDDDGDVVARMR